MQTRRSWARTRLLLSALAVAAVIPALGGEEAKPAKALLVVDMQKMYVDRAPEPGFVENVNRVIDATRGKVLTVYILDDGGGPLDRRVHRVSKVRFEKKNTDAFTNPALGRFLQEHGVRDVTLIGLDASYCVYGTAMGALAAGLRVHVVPDAVSTRFDEHRTAVDRLVTLGADLVTEGDIP